MAALRSKALLGWVATELHVRGEVRLTLRARVEGAGCTMEQQVAAAQEAEAKEGVQALLGAIGEKEESTCEAVIASLTEMELGPSAWVPFLEDLVRDAAAAAQKNEEDEERSGLAPSALLEFIKSVKADGGASDAMAPGPEVQEEVEAEGEDDAAAVAEAAAAAAAREQLDERAAIATRLLEEGRGMGLVSRDELRLLLLRCADSHGTDGTTDSGEPRWEDWEDRLLAPPKLCMERDVEPEKPPTGLTPKEMKKWLKRQERANK